ncbi:ribbon-helix-helix protein, CopG family [Candidatus Woesearchaeota archaeon]|nr:ribbon-helix-helix protein, CopG family [Candidatus Woesearchaeota archaeon]
MKERITISLDKELLDWIDSKVKQRIFANRSHAIEFLAQQKIDEENQ